MRCWIGKVNTASVIRQNEAPDCRRDLLEQADHMEEIDVSPESLYYSFTLRAAGGRVETVSAKTQQTKDVCDNEHKMYIWTWCFLMSSLRVKLDPNPLSRGGAVKNPVDISLFSASGSLKCLRTHGLISSTSGWTPAQSTLMWSNRGPGQASPGDL